MALDRTPRDRQTRVEEAREDFTVPGMFPMDLNNGDPAWRFRWVRTHYNGAEEDKANLHKRMTIGWRPVKAEEFPHLEYLKDAAGNISMGGCTLCKISAEKAQKIVNYYERQAHGQLEGAASEFENDQDPRIPKFHEGNIRSRIIRNPGSK